MQCVANAGHVSCLCTGPQHLGIVATPLLEVRFQSGSRRTESRSAAAASGQGAARFSGLPVLELRNPRARRTLPFQHNSSNLSP